MFWKVVFDWRATDVLVVAADKKAAVLKAVKLAQDWQANLVAVEAWAA